MDLAAAHDICHAPFNDRRLRDIMADYRQEIADALAKGYPADQDALLTIAINGPAFLRGMISAEGVRAEIAEARAVLNAMERALS